MATMWRLHFSGARRRARRPNSASEAGSNRVNVPRGRQSVTAKLVRSKTRGMFSKFTALVAEVVGLGPQQSRPDDFNTHWRAITDCISSADSVSSVSATDIPQHLEAMVELLCDEDSQKDTQDPGTMGPCLEFLLRHRILETLYTPCKNDYPTGIRQEVLMFLIHLLGRMGQPLLPHVSVHQPVQKQIHLCGLHPASPLALKEIQFLRTLCLKIQADPRLADFLITEVPVKRSPIAPSPSLSTTSSSSSSSSSSLTSSSAKSDNPPSTRTVYLVADALQRLVNHNDSLVAMKAYECLLSCVSLRHDRVACVLAISGIPILLASKLQYHFQLIPLSCPHHAILRCNVGWGVDYASRSTTADHSPSTYGLWHVEAYLSWLDFVEQAVAGASAPLYQALCTAVQELLLQASLLPRIMKQAEEDILLSTAILARSIQFITDDSLLSEFVLCVLGGGESESVRSAEGEEGEEEKKGGLRDLIIQRIDHPNDDVCQASLQLISVLLQCPLSAVCLRELVYRPALTISCMDTSPASQLSDDISLAEERKKLEHTISSYLSLVPSELLSAEVVTGETGIEDYLIEAHQQVLKCRKLTQSWYNDDVIEGVWSQSLTPGSPESPLPSPSQRQTETGRDGGEKKRSFRMEGPLVPALLSKLERLLDQSYEVNLLLTSVLSRLAAFSHPLIDQLFSTDDTHNSVYSVLKKVSTELVAHAERSPGFQFNLREVRKRMVGQETSDLLSMPHNDLLEGAIVLEEFCKELSCVLFAKHSTALLTLPQCGIPPSNSSSS